MQADDATIVGLTLANTGSDLAAGSTTSASRCDESESPFGSDVGTAWANDLSEARHTTHSTARQKGVLVQPACFPSGPERSAMKETGGKLGMSDESVSSSASTFVSAATTFSVVAPVHAAHTDRCSTFFVAGSVVVGTAFSGN